MIMKCILHVLARRYGGMSGLASMQGKFKCQGVLLFRIIGQGPTVLAVCAGSCFLEILSLVERQSDVDLNTVFKDRKPSNKQLIKFTGKAVYGISISFHECKKTYAAITVLEASFLRSFFFSYLVCFPVLKREKVKTISTVSFYCYLCKTYI